MKNLPPETPIYKYMGIDSFLHFFMNRSLVLQKIQSWPDYLEGRRFEFFKKNGLIRTESSVEEYFGSCWSLQVDDQRLFDSKEAYQISCKEIRELGSAAMWETNRPIQSPRNLNPLKRLSSINEPVFVTKMNIGSL